jgi:hypothetical protein
MRQIVLQKEGEDADPTAKHVAINVQSIITELVDADKIKEAQEKAKKSAEKAAQVAKELDNQKETFMKEIANLEAQIRQLKSQPGNDTENNLEVVELKKEISRLENILRERFLSEAEKNGAPASGIPPDILSRLMGQGNHLHILQALYLLSIVCYHWIQLIGIDGAGSANASGISNVHAHH